MAEALATAAASAVAEASNKCCPNQAKGEGGVLEGQGCGQALGSARPACYQRMPPAQLPPSLRPPLSPSTAIADSLAISKQIATATASGAHPAGASAG